MTFSYKIFLPLVFIWTISVYAETYVVPVKVSVPPGSSDRNVAMTFSKVEVSPGDHVTIEIAGMAAGGPGFPLFDANGNPASRANGGQFPSITGLDNIYCVIAKIGTGGNWFGVGTKLEFEATQAGEIIFLLNDAINRSNWSPAYEDNSGNYVATITVGGCNACDAGSCRSGSGRLDVGSASAEFPLGQTANGRSAGKLFFEFEAPSLSSATVNSLKAAVSIESMIVTNSNGTVRQVLAPESLADVVTIDPFKYEIRFYTRANVGSTNSFGVYTVSGDPFAKWMIENPSGSASDIDTLRLTEVLGSGNRVNEFFWPDSNNQQIELRTGNGARKENHTSTIESGSGDRIETITIKDSADVVVYKESRRHSTFAWGEELTETIVDPDNAALKTTRTYYDNAGSDGNNYKHLKQIVQPTGYWERYEYDGVGRLTKQVSQHLDAASSAVDSLSRVVTFQYVAGQSSPNETRVETLLGTEIGRRYTFLLAGETRVEQAVTAGAASGNPNNLVTVTKYDRTVSVFQGELSSVKNAMEHLSFIPIPRTTMATKQPQERVVNPMGPKPISWMEPEP